MPDKSELLNELYKNIAHELDISRTMRGKAERAYKSVGEYLDGDDLEAQVYTQGSFSLGTVTRPISGEDDDYDIDLVCEMPAMASSSAREIKNVVGDKLKESGVYGPKLEPEGKRCWTLTFDEFHMDVLPCVPEVPDPGDTAVALTHKAGDGLYLRKSSDPRAYQEWFEGRMGESLTTAKRRELGVAYASVNKVPTFAVSTPLQMAVRIMKHHRDVMFEGREDAPISIIITTLAALSYDQTAGVFDTIADVLGKMDSRIDRSNGSYVIKSPVDERENYADKWNEDPRKARAFYEWLESARRDLVQAPLTLDGIDEIGKSLKGRLAERAVTSAVTRLGEGLREARDGGRLYATTAAGITLSSTAGAVPVRSHTFYGA